MTTLALLGTAALISIALGIPLGPLLCKAASVLRCHSTHHGLHADDAFIRGS